MTKPAAPPFDAGEWTRLARSDPQEFERRRIEAIEEAIAAAPADQQQRLRCLQWRIDMERRRCPNPLAACIRLNELMWEFVYSERGLLNALNGLVQAFSGEANEGGERRQARVLAFRPPSLKGGRPG